VSTEEGAESRFRAMADHAPVMLWLADTTGNCEFFNKQWLDFTGRPMEAELGVGWAEGVHFEDFQHCMATYLGAFAARRTFRMEYRLRRHDGEFRWILDTGTPRYEAQTFLGYVGSCIDITEIRDAREMQRRLAEDLERHVRDRTAELERRLREREVLLREIHHRVKNNLQVVSSLIAIQANRLPPTLRTALDECQARIRTIALVHQRLYQTSDLTNIELELYVRELASNVHAAIGAPEIELAVDCVAIDLPVDAAIPCGLILNELLTNAFKHAFPGGRRGTVRVTGERTDGYIRIVVRDDGTGLPAGFDLAATPTLGFQLVSALVDQLNARIRFGNDGGAWFEIAFRA
jgi:PAS domain S-box-containing protein